MPTKDASASVKVGDVNGLAEQYRAALLTGDLPHAEEIATTLWERCLFDCALRQARDLWKELDQHVERQEFAELCRERFVTDLTRERRESRTLTDVYAHIEDALKRATECIVLGLLVRQCQRAAARRNEPEYQQCFWSFCAISWNHVTRKLKQYPQYAWLESEILDFVERRLHSRLRQPKPIEHVFGYLDVVIARSVSRVVRHYEARAPTERRPVDTGQPPARPAQEYFLEVQHLWNQIERWVAEIDRATGEEKKLSLIFHLDLAGQTQAEIAQILTPPITQGEVSKRMKYLCRELVQRIFAFLKLEVQPPGGLPVGWQRRMIEALREMKKF